MGSLIDDVAVVVIGRNEGGRLIDCLNSLVPYTNKVVYVDSASTDNSVREAETLGVNTLSLDMSRPFSAARARNTGFEFIINKYPDIKYIQFVDGDCQVDSNWLITASNFLSSHNEVAVVCGRRRERFPESTIYNEMCDDEWNTPIGEAKACGGDALMRVSVFSYVGGYRESLIAGEEPELCIRIRDAGYKVWRLNAEMTLHDANITSFKQWWKRSVRAGYAFAEGAFLHGKPPECHWVAESIRAWLWGFLLPLLIISIGIFKPTWAILLLLVYLLQWFRLSLRGSRSFFKSSYFAFYSILGKFAEITGQIKFIFSLLSKKQIKIIEYK